MKHLFFFLTAILSISSAWAQSLVGLNPSPHVEKTSSYAYAPQAEDEITISWLTSETMTNSFGFGATSGGTMGAFMEFYSEDLINFNSTGKKPVAVKQVQFYLNPEFSANVTSGKIVIRQGASLSVSTEVASQTVNAFTGGWNYVNLTENYTIDPIQNIYIGYEITFSRGYPVAVAAGTNTKQGWLVVNGSVDNLASYGNFVALIKAVTLTETSPVNAALIQTVNIPNYAIAGDNISVTGLVKNVGSAPLTSLTLNYSANGQEASPYHVTGINIAPNATYSFTHPEAFTATEAKTCPVTITATKPNEDNDALPGSKTIEVNVYSTLVQRVLLHESFTSSTCAPCKAGNANLLTVLNAADEFKWANIRYQMSWPSTGDPYYTAEGGSKREFYGVNSVPELEVDGIKFNNHPGDYSIALFNQLSAIPAATVLTGDAEITEQTVSASISVTPVITKNMQDFRLFAAVVERTTTKNKKTNGETLFHNVMKKFLTNVNGDPVGNFEVDVNQPFNYSYTFQGNYRLPTAAVNSTNQYIGINHAIEHSVEDFGNLIVVYWIQNVKTGEVLQAGKAAATPQVGISSIAKDNNTTASIHDGLLYLQSATPVQSIEIYTVAGQRVLSQTVAGKTVAVNRLNAGIYIVKVKTADGEKAIKVIK